MPTGDHGGIAARRRSTKSTIRGSSITGSFGWQMNGGGRRPPAAGLPPRRRERSSVDIRPGSPMRRACSTQAGCDDAAGAVRYLRAFPARRAAACCRLLLPRVNHCRSARKEEKEKIAGENRGRLKRSTIGAVGEEDRAAVLTAMLTRSADFGIAPRAPPCATPRRPFSKPCSRNQATCAPSRDGPNRIYRRRGVFHRFPDASTSAGSGFGVGEPSSWSSPRK